MPRKLLKHLTKEWSRIKQVQAVILDDFDPRLQSQMRNYKVNNMLWIMLDCTLSQKQIEIEWFLVKCSDSRYCEQHSHKGTCLWFCDKKSLFKSQNCAKFTLQMPDCIPPLDAK